MPSTWSVRLENLKILDADEEGTFSDGDEPYLVVIGFRSRFQTPGSTEVFWRCMLDDKWGDHAHDGSVRPIPEEMGVVTFEGIEQIGQISYGLGRQPELIGALVAAFESDATPFSDIRDGVHDVMDALKPALEDVVAKSPGFDFDADLEPQVKAFLERVSGAIAHVTEELSPSLIKKIGVFLKSFGDADRLVGAGTLVFATVDPDLAPGAPLPYLTEQPINLDFHVKGIFYSGRGRVTKDAFTLIGSPLIEEQPPPAQMRHTAVWKRSTEGEIQVYGWTYEDGRKLYDKLWNQGWRLKLLQPFVLPGGQVRYTAVWKPSTEGEIQVYGWTYDDFRKKYDELWNQGWRLKLLQPFPV